MTKLTKLPEKWCVHVVEGGQETNPEVYEWRKQYFSREGYIHSNKWHSKTIMEGYTEITFSQFKEWVLGKKVYTLTSNNWCIQGGDDLGKWITNFEEKTSKFIDIYGRNNEHYYFPLNDSLTEWDYTDFTPHQGKDLISFSEFEEIVKESKACNSDETGITEELIINKNTKMVEFRITGSLALIEAFIKDSGFPYHSDMEMLRHNYNDGYVWIGPSQRHAKTYALYVVPAPNKAFNLPADYDKAMDYVKNYFNEPASFTLGKYSCTIKGGNVIIEGRGFVPITSCVNIIDKLKNIKHLGVYGGFDVEITSEISHIHIGCCNDIPVKDIMAVESLLRENL